MAASTAVVAAALGFAPSAAVAEGQATVRRYPVSAAFTDTSLCPFPVSVSISGFFVDVLVSDQSGEPVRFVGTGSNGRISLATSTVTLTSVGTGVLNVTYDETGGVESLRTAGVSFAVTVPHDGVVLLSVGTLFFSSDGVSFQSGPDQLGDGDTARLCTALRG